MMQILIDNKDLKGVYDITVLDYTPALNFPAERENERKWTDKSGVDKNLENIRYDPKEFLLECYCKAVNEGAAYDLVQTLVDYMFTKGIFILSLRDSAQGIRKAFLCERSNTIVSTISIRPQNSLYRFKLGLKDVNPNAIVYYNTIVGLASTINYTKGQTAVLYWGDGAQGLVSNSGNYTKNDYSANGPVDIIIDLDKNTEIITTLVAAFSANPVTGESRLTVNFTDASIGDIQIWSWIFGDGNTSDQPNPIHQYVLEGVYTVILQVFNDAGGSSVETKTGYITVNDAKGIQNNAGEFGIQNNAGEFGILN